MSILQAVSDFMDGFNKWLEGSANEFEWKLFYAI